MQLSASLPDDCFTLKKLTVVEKSHIIHICDSVSICVRLTPRAKKIMKKKSKVPIRLNANTAYQPLPELVVSYQLHLVAAAIMLTDRI